MESSVYPRKLRPIFERALKSLIEKPFTATSTFMWITLLTDLRPLASKPEKSRAWLECPEKRHWRKSLKINDLAALWLL
jgi:hypothetical protein